MNNAMSTPPSVVLRYLTSPRLSSFMSAAGGDPALALRLYEWNAAVSAESFRLIGQVEVVVRNAVHGTLADWSAELDTGSWFENRHGYLQSEAVRTVSRTKARLALRRRRITEDAVISDLNFGFWRHLLSGPYKSTLWPFAMRSAFPHLPSADAPKLFKAMAQLHVLRNRVAHHEPIHQRDLASDYAAGCFVLGAVSPAVETWATGEGRIPALLAQRP